MTYDCVDYFERCNSLDAVYIAFYDEMTKFKEHRDGNRKLINGITSVVLPVHAFADILGEATGHWSREDCPSQLVFQHQPSSPGKAIFAGVKVLLTVYMFPSRFYRAPVTRILGGNKGQRHLSDL